MASVVYEQILEVQAFDLRVIQLRHQVATHPSRAELAEATQQLAVVDEQMAEIGSRMHELERTQKRLADEVETVEARRSAIDGKLYGGTVTASKELLALQDEAAQLLARQRLIEDEELVFMESLEEESAERERVDGERSKVVELSERATTTLAEGTAELEREIVEIVENRTTAASLANAELLAHYEDLSPQYDGVAVARLVDGRCDGCHIQLSAVAVDQLGRAPENAVVTCEECGRLLVR